MGLLFFINMKYGNYNYKLFIIYSRSYAIYMIHIYHENLIIIICRFERLAAWVCEIPRSDCGFRIGVAIIVCNTYKNAQIRGRLMPER
jgi:hypothetical protein